MANSTAESFLLDSDITRNTDSEISVDFLLFGGNLVEKAFEAAMAALHFNDDYNEVLINGEQQADHQEASMPGNDPGGTENTAAREQQENIDVGSSKPSHSDHIYDEVDANITSNASQDENRLKLAGDHSSSIEQKKDQSGAIEGEDKSNPAVPKIEIFEGSTTLSDSSSDEDSDDREERRKKKLTRKKKKTDRNISDDENDLDELKSEVERLTKENETMKEQIENLSKEKTSLDENLEDEKRKMQTLRDDLSREKEKLHEQLTKQSGERGSSATVVAKEKLITELRQEIQQLQDNVTELKTSIEDSQKQKEETISSSRESIHELKNRLKELEAENRAKDRRLEGASNDVNKSLSSLHDQEKLSSSLQEEIDLLKNQVELLQEDAASKEEELGKAQERERKATQENSKLQAKLSNAQTLSSHHDGVVQKLRSEIASLQQQNKLLEKKGSQIEQKVTQEAHRKLQDRIRELEEKVIKVNEEKKKIKTDYEEAVKALEAVDKVYSVREDMLEKYKADYENATDKIQENEKEIIRLKSDLSKNKEKLTRALEYKADREELKDHLRKSKEAIALQKEETDQVRKDLDEERHVLKMAQARGQERGRKIQMLNLELTELKDTLQIAKNVIDEKENNMKSIRGSLEAEKQQKVKLEKELEIMSHLEKKLQYVEEETHRLECRLKNTELELKETQTSLEQSNSKRRELDKNVDNLEQDKKHVCKQLEEKGVEIANLKEKVSQQDQELGEKFREIVQQEIQLDELREQLWDVWNSYQNDREWWKQRADKVMGRRPKSAPPRRRPASEFQNIGMTLSSRRLMNRMGAPRLNPSYIKSRQKIAWQRPAPAGEERAPGETTRENGDVNDGSPQNATGHTSAPETSPRPPSTPQPGKPRPKRPASSYGIRTQPPSNWTRRDDDDMIGMGHYSDMGPVMEEEDLNGYNADEEVLASCAVHKGDKVMIQSRVTGEEKMNITGLVKYVGKLGSGGNSTSMFVGLKLDQPGNTDGRLGGRQYFQCPPKHGKVVKMSDIHAVMNPRTRNYSRIRPMTFDY